jgi:protein-disulfide isomerase
MPIHRRRLLSVVATSLAVPAVLGARPAHAADPHEADRAIGNADAKTTVQEFFSLTCTHCAAFARETFSQIKSELIDTGKLRWVFRDFPLDQVALEASMVARYLPPDRYEPFVMALFANQDRWAFARGVDSTDELWKTAALAGMSKTTFDQAIADNDLKTWILAQQADDQKKWGIDATPSFVVNGKMYSGEMSFDAFRKLIPDS